jgi:uncharacterized damage-inducible protein DinB
MSWLEQYRALARYNQWMNRKLYTLSAQLDDEERKRDRGAFFKSIHGTLNHLLLADCTWLSRFSADKGPLPRDRQGEPIRITSLAQELYADFAELAVERARIDELLLDYTNQLSEEQLLAPLSYKTSAGVPQSQALWRAVGHVFNHQTHHRGQLTTLLSQAGLQPDVTDLVAMLREEASHTA